MLLVGVAFGLLAFQEKRIRVAKDSANKMWQAAIMQHLGEAHGENGYGCGLVSEGGAPFRAFITYYATNSDGVAEFRQTPIGVHFTNNFGMIIRGAYGGDDRRYSNLVSKL